MIKKIILTLLPLVLPLYVVRFHIGPLPTTLLEVSLLVFLGLWIFERYRSPQTEGEATSPLRPTPYALPAILWLMAGLVSVFIAPDHIAALGLFRAYFIEPLLVLWMLTDLVQTEEDKNVLLRSLSYIVMIVAAWAVVQFITHRGIPSPWDKPPNGIRATGPFPFPNALALFVVPIVAVLFTFALRTKGVWHTPLLWIGFFAAALSTALAKSVGGMLGLGAAMLIALLIHKKTRRLTLLAACSLSLVAFSVSPIRTKLADKFLFKEWSGKVRLVIWKETRTMLTDRPIFGAGLGAYPTVIKPYHKATWMEIFQYPHNILLNLWSELGLLGIFAFAWILWRLWSVAGLKSLPFLAAILVHGLVDVPYFKNDLALVFWILVVLVSFGYEKASGLVRGDDANGITQRQKA